MAECRVKGLCKNDYYEHHSRNFDESILKGLTPIELRMKKKRGINVINIGRFYATMEFGYKKYRKVFGRSIM